MVMPITRLLQPALVLVPALFVLAISWPVAVPATVPDHGGVKRLRQMNTMAGSH
jgi:hypothetical protein